VELEERSVSSHVLDSVSRRFEQATERLSHVVQNATQPSIETKVLEALGSLDEDRLIEVLRNGDIRLVRSAWLRAKPAGYRIERRQELEELEKSGQSPLLSPEEAVALVRRGTRSAGALTYPWCASPHP